MKNQKLISMTQFILEIDWMTTKEFCEKYNIPVPTPKEGAYGFFRVDAVKQNRIVEYAKFLNKEVTKEILTDKLGFLPMNPYKNSCFENGNHKITRDCLGFFLEPYDSCDGFRANKVEDLVGLDIYYTHKK